MVVLDAVPIITIVLRARDVVRKVMNFFFKMCSCLVVKGLGIMVLQESVWHLFKMIQIQLVSREKVVVKLQSAPLIPPIDGL